MAGGILSGLQDYVHAAVLCMNVGFSNENEHRILACICFHPSCFQFEECCFLFSIWIIKDFIQFPSRFQMEKNLEFWLGMLIVFTTCHGHMTITSLCQLPLTAQLGVGYWVPRPHSSTCHTPLTSILPSFIPLSRIS